MPTPELDMAPIKVTLNLYAVDVEYLKNHIPRGQGWTTYVRELVHNHCVVMKRDVVIGDSHER